jgi:predicted hydrocarbon binding protein
MSVFLEPLPKHVLVAIYDPGRVIFLVYARTKNVPGAFGDIASRLGQAGLNILSVSNSSEPGKKESSLGLFAEAADNRMTAKEVADALAASRFVLDTYVKRNEGGFAVDDFGFPINYYPGGRGVLLPQTGLASMFQDILTLYGSGGEAILYRAGHSVGRQGTDELAKVFGEAGMLEASTSFMKLYNALGWGQLEVEEVSNDFSTWTLALSQSFECTGLRRAKPQAHFTRGLIAGSAERLLNTPMKCVEVKCVAAGETHCSFKVSPA